jgi:hypothetical protein
MKSLLLILSLLYGLLLNAQNRDTLPDGSYLKPQEDSTDIKLQHYKDLFVKGLISEQEYQQLKNNVLHLGTTQQKEASPNKAKPIASNGLYDSYMEKRTANLIPGIILTVAAPPLIISSIVLLADNYSPNYHAYQITGGILLVAGTLALIGSPITLVKAHHYKILADKYKGIAYLTPPSLNIAMQGNKYVVGFNTALTF